MNKNVEVSLLGPDQWERLKQIRIRALKANPDAFGADLNEVETRSREDWIRDYAKEDYLVASINGVDAGMLYIEVLNGDHGATCWIGGCWTDPTYRGKGAMRALFDFIDKNASQKNWMRQGLGVWTDNYTAIKAYESLGFAFVGEKMPGSREGKFFQHLVRDSST
jgi:GNAT superfamily N-acetyltransferase